MQTLAQIRAKNALNKQVEPGAGGGDVLRSFPSLVKTDGFLAALAFASETKQDGKLKHRGEHGICRHIAEHLHALHISENTDPRQLAQELAEGDASKLRRATAEALAYLNYLKRFATYA